MIHTLHVSRLQEADMAAASMTISPARKAVIDFTEPYMTLHTTVLIKKSPATDEAITSVEDLVGQSEVKYGLMKDGITEDFFKYTSNAVYRQIWRTIQVGQLMLVNSGG